MEIYTFGSEYIAAKSATEMMQALQCTLSAMGIPIDGLTDIFFDMKLFSGIQPCQNRHGHKSILKFVATAYKEYVHQD